MKEEEFDLIVAATFRVRVNGVRGSLCFGTHCADPGSHLLCDKLRPIVRLYVFRGAAQDEQIGQSVDHTDRIEFSTHADRQSLLCELVGDVERAEDPPDVRPVLGKLIGPDMVRVFRPQPDVRPFYGSHAIRCCSAFR